MCGINGFVKKNCKPLEAEGLIKDMNKAINHRGPDDSGSFIFEINDSSTLGLGQDRLSIIDLSPAGHQPMFYKSGFGGNSSRFKLQDDNELSIVFNGEIYNYQEIKDELINKGYSFSTKSDTEVILASYMEWGDECVSRFNGMWAFCIYDFNRNKVFCSRDRLGKKSFYYYIDGTNFIFSSELKGILAHKKLGINSKENLSSDAIDFYFSIGYIPAPWTIYKNVNKLEARNNLNIDLSNFNHHISCYYDIPEYDPSFDKTALIEEGKEILEDATKIRMFTSDVPVGAFLSGGLDSSAVVGEMTKWSDKEKLHTFSIGFEGKFDETEYVNIVKDAFGTQHHHEYFRESDFEKIVDKIYHFYDEPFGDFSNFPTTFVSALAKKNVTVCLSGDGGDEIFGGYDIHKIGAQLKMLFMIPEKIRKMIYNLIPLKNTIGFVYKLKEALRISFLPIEEFYAHLGEDFVYKPNIYKDWSISKLQLITAKNGYDFIQTLIDFDLFFNTLPDNYLVKVDRASMSQALEVRSPFLDYRFIEFSRKIPSKWKVDFRKTKKLMREIVKDIVPDVIVNRKKQGFESPIKIWMKQEKYDILINKIIEIYEKENILSSNWLDFYKKKVLKTNNDIYSVYKMRLFFFSIWYENFIK